MKLDEIIRKQVERDYGVTSLHKIMMSIQIPETLSYDKLSHAILAVVRGKCKDLGILDYDGGTAIYKKKEM